MNLSWILDDLINEGVDKYFHFGIVVDIVFSSMPKREIVETKWLYHFLSMMSNMLPNGETLAY